MLTWLRSGLWFDLMNFRSSGMLEETSMLDSDCCLSYNPDVNRIPNALVSRVCPVFAHA